MRAAEIVYDIMFSADTDAWRVINRLWVYQGNEEPLYRIFTPLEEICR